MSVLTGVALLCYAVNIYLMLPPVSVAADRQRQA